MNLALVIIFSPEGMDIEAYEPIPVDPVDPVDPVESVDEFTQALRAFIEYLNTPSAPSAPSASSAPIEVVGCPVCGSYSVETLVETRICHTCNAIWEIGDEPNAGIMGINGRILYGREARQAYDFYRYFGP